MLKDRNINITDIYNSGFKFEEMKDAGYTALDLKYNFNLNLDFLFNKLKYEINEIKNCGFKLHEIYSLNKGFPDKKKVTYLDLKNGGYNLQDFVNSNIELKEISKIFDHKEIINFKDVSGIKFSIKDLEEANINKKLILKESKKLNEINEKLKIKQSSIKRNLDINLLKMQGLNIYDILNLGASFSNIFEHYSINDICFELDLKNKLTSKILVELKNKNIEAKELKNILIKLKKFKIQDILISLDNVKFTNVIFSGGLNVKDIYFKIKDCIYDFETTDKNNIYFDFEGNSKPLNQINIFYKTKKEKFRVKYIENKFDKTFDILNYLCNDNCELDESVPSLKISINIISIENFNNALKFVNIFNIKNKENNYSKNLRKFSIPISNLNN
jgi:hypothetical protein